MRLMSRMPLALILVLSCLAIGIPGRVMPLAGVRAQSRTGAGPAVNTVSVTVTVSPNPTIVGMSTGIAVTTAGGLACTLTITLPSGASVAPPNNQVGSGSGSATFTYLPTSPGQNTAVVQCTDPLSAGIAGTGSASFNVLPQSITATATAYPSPVPGQEQVYVQNSTLLVPGTTFTLVGYGFHPGATYVYAPFGAATLVTAVADSSGNLVIPNLTVPYTQPPGQWTALLHNINYSFDQLSVTLTVQALAPTLKLSPTAAPPGGTVGLTGSGFGGNEVVDINLGPDQLLTVKASNTGEFTGTVTVPSNLPTGAFAIGARGESTGQLASTPFTIQPAPTATATAVPGTTVPTATTPPTATPLVPSPTPIPPAPTPGPTVTTFYFAEGTTANQTQVNFNVLNPDTHPAHLTFSLVFPDGRVDTTQYIAAPQSYSIVNGNGLVDVQELGQPFSTKVTADQQISVARAVIRPNQDGTLTDGAPAALHYSDFAEGYTARGFQERLALFNPANANANVELRLLPSDGSAPLIQRYVIGPLRRDTIDVNSLRPNRSLGAQVVSDIELSVDRTLTFGAGGHGETTTTGISAPQQTWYFAEGSTRNGFSEFLTLLNPNTSQARVSVQCFDTHGRRIGARTVLIRPRERATVNVETIVRAVSVSAIVQSSLPILAERSMYHGGLQSAQVSGTTSFGRSTLYPYYEFPSGDTSSGDSEFLLLLNPGNNPLSVQAQFFPASGATVTTQYLIPAHARLTIDVGRDVASLPAGPHAIIVRSTDGTTPFMAEQSLYGPGFSSAANTLGIARQGPDQPPLG